MRHYEKIIMVVWITGVGGYFIEYKRNFNIYNLLDVIVGVITLITFFIYLRISHLDLTLSKQKSTPKIKKLVKGTFASLSFILLIFALTYIIMKLMLFLLPFILRPEIDVPLFSLISTVIIISILLLFKQRWLYNKIIDLFKL